MADKVDHTHGDTGTKPSQDLNFQDSDYPDPQEFDWFWSQVPSAINDHADRLEDIDGDEDGVVDRSDELSSSSVGDGLSGGDSTAISVEASQLTGEGVKDDGNNNLRVIDEYIQDLVAGLVSASSNLSWSYDDQNNSLTINTSALNDEEVEDVVGDLIQQGQGVNVAYNDSQSTLTVSIPDNTITGSMVAFDSDNDGKVDAAEDADTVGGETPSSFADTNHGNEEHSSDFVTLSEVNNQADVPNADHADQADNATTVDGESPSNFADTNHGNEEHSSQFTTLTEVNNNADVPNADQADSANYASTAGDAQTLDGNSPSDLEYTDQEAIDAAAGGMIPNDPSQFKFPEGSTTYQGSASDDNHDEKVNTTIDTSSRAYVKFEAVIENEGGSEEYAHLDISVAGIEHQVVDGPIPADDYVSGTIYVDVISEANPSMNIYFTDLGEVSNSSFSWSVDQRMNLTGSDVV
jgi:hypothetical protein